MKKVFICETPFQVIVSLFVKEQFTKPSDEVDLVIVDTFSGYDKVAEKIKEKGIYNKVYTAKLKNVISFKNLWQYIPKLFFILFPKIMINRRWSKNIEKYDEMYCWNYDVFTASVRSYYAFRGHYPKVFMCEEAYMSYFPINDMYPIRGFMKILETRNKLFGKSNIVRSNIDGWLFFEPENLLYKPNCKIYQIKRDLSSKKEFKDTVDYIFGASKVIKNYDKKYIIFEEAALANNKDIDDEKVFDKIIDIVGRENVIIKLHPRTSTDRFTKKGIKTLGSDGIPWEAITCVGDFSDKVFISISSSSITTYKMFYGNKMNAYMLFKFLKPNLKQFDSKYDEFWDKFGKVTDEGGIHIPETEEEFYECLKKEVEKDEK